MGDSNYVGRSAVAAEKKQTALQRWGSSDSPTSRIVGLLVALTIVGVMFGGGIYFGQKVTDDRLEREQVLDDRYTEDIEIGVATPGTMEFEVIQINGSPRNDCEETDDGFLECSDGPQPTLVSAAD